MPVTEQQARAITFLAMAARPTGAPRWDEGGVYANVMKVADRAVGAVTIAVIQAAEDRNAQSPGVIPTNGPHWRDPAAAPAEERPRFDAMRTCSVCSLTREACELRWANDPDGHVFVSVDRARAGRVVAAETARAGSEAAKAALIETRTWPARTTPTPAEETAQWLTCET